MVDNLKDNEPFGTLSFLHFFFVYPSLSGEKKEDRYELQ